MYIFEIADIMFFIKNLKPPTSNFNIIDYVTQLGLASSGSELIYNFCHNKIRSFYLTGLHSYGTHSQLLTSINLLTT